MKVDLAQCINKGMQRDYSMDKSSQEFAYENKNIRITTTGDNTFLSVTNEKSTIPVTIEHPVAGIKGIILGSVVLGDFLVVFTKADFDYIYRFNIGRNESNFEAVILYEGDLNFQYDNPIECIISYEADDIQKVYWVDGINQPRVINIINRNDDGEDIKYPRNTSFDFVPPIPSNIDVTIEKQHNGAGVFPSGIIQYYITYYKKFGPETNSVYQSPLYYISPSDRGGQADETQTCSFKLTITPKSNEFDYVRVYSLIRTSYNAEPIVSIVGDINIKSSDNLRVVTITDTNVSNIPVASTDIMFLGGNTITASTIEQKDNTLFLGNISSKKEDIVSQIKSLTNKGRLQFCIKRSFVESSNNQYYPYAPEMDSSSINKTTFKYLEWYRFGLQVQLPTGEWSSTIYLGDEQNTIPPDQYVGDVPIYPPIDPELIDEDTDEPTTKQEQYLTGIQFEMSSDLINTLADNSISNWRLVVAQHDANTRTVKAQGLVLPTIFNIEQRNNRTCYASPLWTLNTCLYGQHLMNIDPSYGVTPTQPLQEVKVNLSAHSHINSADKTFDYINNGTEQQLSQLSSVISNESHEFNSDTEEYYLSSIQPVITIGRDPGGGFDYVVASIKVTIKHFNDVNTEYCNYLINSSENPNRVFSEHFICGRRKKALTKVSEYLGIILWSELQDYGVTLPNETFVPITNIVGCEGINRVFNPNEIPSGKALRNNYGVTYNNSKEIVLPVYGRKAIASKHTELVSKYSNDYFLDANTCNFVSPDLDNIQGSLKFRIVGSTDITNSISDYEIKVKNNVIDGVYYTYAKHQLNNYKFSAFQNSEIYNTGIKSFPLWPFNNKLYNINYWHPAGPIIQYNEGGEGATNQYYFDLDSKTFANMWVLGSNTYFNSIDYGLAEEYTKINNETTMINGGIYKGEYEHSLISKSNKNFALPENSNTGGVNETTPFEVVSEYLSNSDTALINRKPSATSIKHSSAPHGVFQLGKKNSLSNILPNYGNDISGASTIFDEDFPIGRIDVNNIWAVKSDNIKSSIIDYIIKHNNVNNIAENNCTLIVNDTYDTGNGEEEPEELLNVTLTSTSWGDIDVDELVEELGYLRLLTITGFNDYSLVANGSRIKDYYGIEIISDKITTHNNISTNIGYNGSSVSPTYSANDILLLLTSSDGGDDKQPIGILLKGVTIIPGSNAFNVNRVEILNQETLFKCIINVDSTEYLIANFGNTSAIVKKLSTYISEPITTTSKLHIGEFYIDYDENSFMGGKGENAIELNTFIPISGDYPQIIRDETVTGYGLEGDTYYQRWDYLRIYPTSDTDVNKPIDALSMMVETYKNLDGDYRKLRGRLDTINLTVDNTNTTINEVYSQPNNYTTSAVLDEKFDDSTHPTMYTWSLTKQPLAEVDNWTKVNLISANKLDGDKGNLNKIKRWNNSLFAFQDKAIAIINFNQQTTLSTSNGVPVEIANSGKVSGHYYLTTTQGCKNKWSIIDSPYGLYFIDSYNKSINVLGDGIKSLSSYHLFDDWIRENECGASWLPTDATGFKSFYDPIHKEVYFINNETALCYNEILGQFTSFYDYQNTNTMVNIGNHIYGINGSDIYLMFEGNDYCNLYDNQREYYMTYKVNKDSFIEKTWTNIEYRADIFNDGNTSNNNANKIATETFDTLKVWNEYQSGVSNLMEGRYPNAKVKFRIWRADIPRDTREGKGLNRIRNPWVMLELKKSSNTHKRMEFHDLLVKYLS